MRRSSIKRKTRLKAKGKPRFKKGRDPAYVAWVKTQPCILQGTWTCTWFGSFHHADHVRTRGAGGTDMGNLVSQCPGHHIERHQIGIRSFEKKYGIDLETMALEFARRYWLEVLAA